MEEKIVTARIFLASPMETVFACIATEAGRTRFWAERAPEIDGRIHLEFSNGMKLESRILAVEPPHLFSFEYFGGSRASFRLEAEAGGTVLTLEEQNIPEQWFADQRAGWVTVLLALKAAVDFDIDLRNPQAEFDWEHGFVDV